MKWLNSDIKKVCIFTAEITYLGFQVNKDGFLPLPEKVEIIKNAEVPKNMTELKSFFGFDKLLSETLF